MTQTDTVIRRVVTLHGYTASVDSHWFPSLRASLAARGVETASVALPVPDAPDAAAWEAATDAVLGTPDESTWVVAHSLGCVTALRVLAARADDWRLGGLLLVSGFTGKLSNIPELDDFLAADVDVEAIVPRIRRIETIHSDDDDIVAPHLSAALSERLGARSLVVPGGGHFLGAQGFTDAGFVLERVA